MGRGTIFMLFAVLSGALAGYFFFIAGPVGIPYALCALVWGLLAVVEWTTQEHDDEE